MRRIVVALVVALLALSLTGCGGGSEATTEDPPEAAASAETPVTEGTLNPDRSANDSDIAPTPFPSFATTETPAIFTEKLNAKRPMLVFFHDNRQQVTADLRTEVDAVMAEYRGLIDLITFNSEGEVSSPDVQAAVTYATELGVTGTPYLLVVDGNGFITWRSKGFAERNVIEREVERATR